MFPLVDPAWLDDHFGARSPDKKAEIDSELRLIDVRWYLSGKRGKDAYDVGHLPNAVFLDLDTQLAGDPKIGPGRHPIPSAEAFERLMREIGVNDSTMVVVYDDAGGSIAGRLWWLLRYYGHDQVAVLDGGIEAWKKGRRVLSTKAPTFPPGDFAVKRSRISKVDRAEVRRALARGALVIDARAHDRYRGESEPVDPKPGHIPGAVNAPWSENLVSGKFLPVGDLGAKYRDFGANSDREIIVYCGSGVTACHDLIALELAGIPGAKLYEGSWSDWSKQADPGAIATGEDPGKL
ncbi:MAG: sulfurtransferase [Polyangiaceae bacterium]